MSVQRIPKLFFQKSKDKLPDYIHAMIRHSLTDEWTYINYVNGDEVKYFEENPLPEFPDIIERFNRIKSGIARSELFRYYVLYTKGGVYIDSDAMIYEPVEEIIKDYEFFSVNSWVPNTISLCVVASIKQHPFIYENLLIAYNNDYELNNHLHYLCSQLNVTYSSYKGDKSKFILFDEIRTEGGDRIVDSTGKLLFKHFWKNKENIPNHLLCLPITSKKKNLIYMCVFFNKDYFKLLNLLLLSMITYSSIDTFDILIITSSDFEQTIHELSTKLNIHIQIMTCNYTTIFQAACARLSIFDFSNLSGYEKILYLDTDILITYDLKQVFDIPIEQKLYALESGEINSHNFGGQFFDFNMINPKTSGINSGTLLFLNSQIIKDLFSRIQSHIDTFTSEGTKPPYCMDQPFINYHAIKDSLYDNKTLLPYISLFEGHHPEVSYEEKTICHFSYPIGNFGDKYRRMSEFFYKKLKKGNIISYVDIIDKKFTWSNGYIKFIYDIDSSFKVQTTWGQGYFTILNNNMLYVEWSNHVHILKFNSNYTEYASIRIYPSDFDFVRGKLTDTAKVIIYGDSHALVSFRNLEVPHRNLFDFGKTMYSLGRDKHITNFFPAQLNKYMIYCFVYGEVDVRAHIGKQVYYGKHHEQVCKELVNAYFRTIQKIITEFKLIIIVGISPPTSSSDHESCKIHTPSTGGPLPFIGTDSDRKIYTDYMNSLLMNSCLEYGYTYFNPYSFYTRGDGMMNRELSDNCVHIGKNAHFLEEFNKMLI